VLVAQLPCSSSALASTTTPQPGAAPAAGKQFIVLASYIQQPAGVHGDLADAPAAEQGLLSVLELRRTTPAGAYGSAASAQQPDRAAAGACTLVHHGTVSVPHRISSLAVLSPDTLDAAALLAGGAGDAGCAQAGADGQPGSGRPAGLAAAPAQQDSTTPPLILLAGHKDGVTAYRLWVDDAGAAASTAVQQSLAAAAQAAAWQQASASGTVPGACGAAAAAPATGAQGQARVSCQQAAAWAASPLGAVSALSRQDTHTVAACHFLGSVSLLRLVQRAGDRRLALLPVSCDASSRHALCAAPLSARWLLLGLAPAGVAGLVRDAEAEQAEVAGAHRAAQALLESGFAVQGDGAAAAAAAATPASGFVPAAAEDVARLMAGASASAHPAVGLLCGARLGLRSRPLAAHAAGSAAAADADGGSAGGQGWDSCSARDQQPVLAFSPCGSVASVQLIQRELGQSLLSQQRDLDKLPTSSRRSSSSSRAGGQHVAAAPLQPAASSVVGNTVDVGRLEQHIQEAAACGSLPAEMQAAVHDVMWRLHQLSVQAC
jgi:hypothetical protein